jgi:hypothetical protein
MGEAPTVPGRPYRRTGREREARDFHDQDIGDEAMRFAKWFVRDRFSLMEGFLGELDRDPRERDVVALRRRFLESVAYARKVLVVRAVVTVLLASSVVVTASSVVLERLAGANDAIPALFRIPVAELQALLLLIEGIAASAALLLLVARLAADRYLELIHVTASFTAMQIASGPRAWSGTQVGAGRG